MDPLLFIRCDAFERFGVAPAAVAETGAPVEVWDALDGSPRPEPSSFSGVVLFGSTSNIEHADDLPFIKEVGDVAREAVELGTPFLGLCFGAQVLAWSLGAEVGRSPVRELGFEPLRQRPGAEADPVLGHYGEGDMVFHWHMDTFALPEGARLLAAGDLVPNQAYRFGDVAWATQFHLEVDADEAAYWVNEASAVEDLEATWGKSADVVRREIAEHMADHERRGREAFRRFVDVCRNT